MFHSVAAGGVGITGLRGMGGTGKTVLAENLAKPFAPKLPIGHLYMGLKGASETPMLPLEFRRMRFARLEEQRRLPAFDAGVSERPGATPRPRLAPPSYLFSW